MLNGKLKQAREERLRREAMERAARRKGAQLYPEWVLDGRTMFIVEMVNGGETFLVPPGPVES